MSCVTLSVPKTFTESAVVGELAIPLALTIAGIAALALLGRYALAAMFPVTLVIVMTASAVHQYPFGDERTSTFWEVMFPVLMAFVLLGVSPTFMRLLPKPGAWMIWFKQALAFAMYGTAAWLVWVLAQQAGANAVAMGRPVMYGLALGGPEGVKSVYDKLKQELTSTMQAAGAGRISDITRAMVARAPAAMLKRPVPVVRSLMMRMETVTKMALATPRAAPGSSRFSANPDSSSRAPSS